MGNKESKETQTSQESDRSDTDSSLAEDISIQLGTHEEHGDNNEHDTILGSDGDQLDRTTEEAEFDLQEHINRGVSGSIKDLPKSTTHVQSTNCKKDSKRKLLAY